MGSGAAYTIFQSYLKLEEQLGLGTKMRNVKLRALQMIQRTKNRTAVRKSMSQHQSKDMVF